MTDRLASKRFGAFNRPVADSDLVVAMFRSGQTPKEISAALGLSSSKVWAAITHARERGELPPCRVRCVRDARAIGIQISGDVWSSLDQQARKRHLSVGRLVAHLIDAIADAGIVDAVLDDR